MKSEPGFREDHSSVHTVVRGNTEFALDLYQKLRTVEGNLFFAPYSLSTALAMTYAGSRGKTEKQMAEALCFNLDQAQLHTAFFELQTQVNAMQSRGEVKLNTANAIWPQIGIPFLSEFLEVLRECYGVLVTGVDYGQTEKARRVINDWVCERTEQKIPDLLAPDALDGSTTLVLTNAIYFKGDWLSQFDPDQTHTTEFWRTPSDAVPVQMMAQESEFSFAELGNLQILELPYQGEQISFIVLLPKAVDGLPELEAALSEERLRQWTGSLRQRRVRVLLPKFKLEGEFELSKALMSLGMTDAFGERADFSGMNGAGRLFISQVIHKAVIDVAEEGTEAAAATAVVVKRAFSEPVEFRLDHPFFFMIREKNTGCILFIGRMAAPQAVENMQQ